MVAYNSSIIIKLLFKILKMIKNREIKKILISIANIKINLLF